MNNNKPVRPGRSIPEEGVKAEDRCKFCGRPFAFHSLRGCSGSVAYQRKLDAQLLARKRGQS